MATIGGNTVLDTNTTIEVAANQQSLLIAGTSFSVHTVLTSLNGQGDDFRLRICQNAATAIRAAPVTTDDLILAIYTYITGDQHLHNHLQDQIRVYVYPRDPTDPNPPPRDRAFLFLYHQHQLFLHRYGTTPTSTVFPQAAAVRKNDLRRALSGSVGTDRARSFIKSPFPLYVTRQQIPPEIRRQAKFVLDTDRFREASRIDPSLSEDVLAIQDTAGEQRFNSYEVIRREELRFKLQLALNGLSGRTMEGWQGDDWLEAFRESEEADDSDQGPP